MTTSIKCFNLYGEIAGIIIFIRFNYPVLNIQSWNSSTCGVTRRTRLCSGRSGPLGFSFERGKRFFPSP